MRRLLAALLAVLAVPAAASAAEPTRFSLAGGCWSSPDLQGGEPLRLQATTLGRYLLVRRDGTVLAAGADGRLAPAAEPSGAADLEAQDAPGGAFTLVPESTRRPVATVRFSPAQGCIEVPEAPLNATGTPAKGELPWGEVGGLLEGHMHWMAFEYFGRRFRCGRPWHPYGIKFALPDCASFEGPQGTAASFQNVLNYGNPAQPHSTENFPGFPNQAKDNLTYEGMYWRWVERVWMAGLRLMVMGVNENRVLCMATPNRETNCNEMDTMRRGFQRMYELQDYIDAQAGGPGKGFLRIVKDPFEARRVINAGKMAVVLEIETSEPFDCIGWEQVTCDKAQIDRQLEEMHRLGVRSALLLNKFDNPLSGVRFDSGTTGYLINAGNKVSAGTFFSARTCQGPLRDNTLPTTPADAPATELQRAAGVPGGATPTYPPAPHCNTRGLTELGRHTVKRMMDLGMIVNPDHMSQAAVDDTLTLLESRAYSGVISPHGWVDPGNWPRLWALGGMAFGGHADTDRYAQEWRDFRPQETPFYFGWGYGADLGGLSRQPAPAKEGKITYPFKSYDGKVTFERQRTGTRTFDFTDPDPKRNGVSTYGQYPEWLEDLRRVAGEGFAKDMWRGAEAYLQMWERASGIASKRCFFHKDGITRNGRGPIALGDDADTLLRKAGQPQQRGQAWSWCVKGPANGSAADVAVLDAAGKVVLVGSTAKERHARGGRVGYRSARGLRGTRDAGGGLRLKRDGSRTFVYVVRGGVVRAIAVTSSRLAADRRALRAAVRRVLRAKASAAERRFVPNPAQKGAKLLGRVVAHDHTH